MMNPDSNIAIDVKNVSKSYRLYDKQSNRLKEALHPFRKQFSREFFALRDISFSIFKGETVGIIGKNGSGKSTLLQILCGIIHPSQGGVTAVGKISSLLELGTGFNPEYSGLENIFLNATIMGLSRSEIKGKLDKIIAFADIGDFINQPVKTYSSGMYVRLAFAIQANIDPDILIVDEALAVGDAQFVHRCMLRFHQMQKEGKTILLVTHDAYAVKTLCSRAIWLKTGKIESIGESSFVVDQYLNEIFKQDDWIEEESSDKKDFQEIENEELLVFEQRLGDQSFEITRCNLLNTQHINTQTIDQNQEALVSLKFKNKSSKNLTPLVGLILKDPKGLDIASTISRMEHFSYPTLKPNEELSTTIKIKIPRLHPGPYSLTPTISYIENSEDRIADRLVNSLVFEILAQGECHTLLSLEAKYQIA